MNEVVEVLVLVNKQNVAFPFSRDNCPGHRVPGIEYLQLLRSDLRVHELQCDFIGKISVTVILRLIVRIYLTTSPNGVKV